MVCTDCGASVEFFSPQVGEIEKEIGRKHHYLTTRHTFQIYGVCHDCQRKHSPRESSHNENGGSEKGGKKSDGRRIV